MNTAFEITADDLETVLVKAGENHDEAQVAKVFAEHIADEEGRIEQAALEAEVGDDPEETLNSQTEAAYREIADILFEKRVITKHPYHTEKEWKNEKKAKTTKLCYRDWVEHQIEAGLIWGESDPSPHQCEKM